MLAEFYKDFASETLFFLMLASLSFLKIFKNDGVTSLKASLIRMTHGKNLFCNVKANWIIAL